MLFTPNHPRIRLMRAEEGVCDEAAEACSEEAALSAGDCLLVRESGMQRKIEIILSPSYQLSYHLSYHPTHHPTTVVLNGQNSTFGEDIYSQNIKLFFIINTFCIIFQ